MISKSAHAKKVWVRQWDRLIKHGRLERTDLRDVDTPDGVSHFILMRYWLDSRGP